MFREILHKKIFASMLLLSAAISSAQPLALPAGNELRLLSLNTVTVNQGEQIEAILKPLSDTLELPDYCILSARLSLTAAGGILTTDNVLCVDDEKRVLRAQWQQLISAQDSTSVIELDCVTQSCQQAQLVPGREFYLVLEQDLILHP